MAPTLGGWSKIVRTIKIALGLAGAISLGTSANSTDGPVPCLGINICTGRLNEDASRVWLSNILGVKQPKFKVFVKATAKARVLEVCTVGQYCKVFGQTGSDCDSPQCLELSDIVAVERKRNYLGLAGTSPSEVSVDKLSGARIDANWFRYINRRFGVAVDLPIHGYRYEVPENGSGLTAISIDKKVTITIYSHWVINLFDSATNDVQRSISFLFDKAVSDTIAKNGTVTYSLRKRNFYVISGRFGNDTYYERLTISPECPAIFNAIRIFYPAALERNLDATVSRISLSLGPTCAGEEGPAKFTE
jgi:hypothetical protein